jgi:uncharacterized protein (DUF433 family)
MVLGLLNLLPYQCNERKSGGFPQYINCARIDREDIAMTDQKLLERITLNPKVAVGKPVIKGTRLTVEYILNLFAHGATASEILEEYEGLTPEDLQACFLFATKASLKPCQDRD